MRIAYADPPYPGMSHFYKDHPDYGGEVDHAELVERLERDYDGWILHTASTTLAQVLVHCPEGVRICSWVKGFAAFKRNVPLAYAWEPVLVKRCRIQGRGRMDGVRQIPGARAGIVMRDWIQENMTMQRGLTGAKPDAVVEWALRCAGAERDDEIDDLYPGSGAVTRAIETWRRQGELLK